MMVAVFTGIAMVVVAAVVANERYRAAKRSDIDIDSCLRNIDRLNALAATGLMDAPTSSELDALTSEAAHHLHAPVAIMSLLDDRRAFVAGGHGLDRELEIRRETPVHQSYCKFVVARDGPLKIDDTSRHRLVKHHPATVNGLRSYLGVPIRTRSGQTIGSFCVVDTVARQWTDDDILTLEHLADRAMARVPN